jgi:broad specificity phosphatase PhoE
VLRLEPWQVGVKIVAVRHGSIEGMETKRFRGRHDTPLTASGLLQAEATAVFVGSFCRPTIVYAGPMKRCLQTAGVIASVCNASCEVLGVLNDIDYGTWQNKTFDEIADSHPKQFHTWLAAPHLMRFPDGEELQDVTDRAGDALRFLLQHHQEQTVVLVSHSSFLRALILPIVGQPLSAYWRLAIAPCGVSQIEVSDAESLVTSVNQTSHLSDLAPAEPS